MDDKVKKEVAQVLKSLSNPVKLLFFTLEKSCIMCGEQQKLLEEVAALSGKVSLEVYDQQKDRKTADKYSIDKVPATAIIGKKDHGIRLYGLTGGHEFSSLMQTIIMVSTEKSGLHPELEKMVAAINKPVHLEVMTTLTCPYCPQAVNAANQLALLNDNIRADMVETAEFPRLTAKYDVTNTPKTVVNDGKHSFVGAMSAQGVYMEVLKAIDPNEYQRVEALIREASGHRHVIKPDAKKTYDTIIIGGGPAALSAAVYAARKQLSVLLVSKDIGGQITYTASIDNYLGLPGISGQELKEQFVIHAEQYPIAESLGAGVIRVTRRNGTFTVLTDKKTTFQGRTVIFCTGKEYNRLGVPGEEKFLGHGIAFCATCDAPLYKGRNVAVIGGANSAFTAVRDLIGYAREIHLVHRRDTFSADTVLVEEVKKATNVTFHTMMEVVEFLGTEKLTGIVLRSPEKKKTELTVDGVFLEIGLSPNTDAVKDILKLNKHGEIPVRHDNATEIPGLYAAGDATDVPEKQIVVAAGEGAKAALSVYKYLIDNKLIIQQAPPDEWS